MFSNYSFLFLQLYTQEHNTGSYDSSIFRFWETSILFSIVATLIHIPTNSERVPFLLLGLTAVLCFFDFIFQLKFTIPLSSVLNFTGLDLAHYNSCPSEVIWTVFCFTCQANYACLPTCPTAFIVPQQDKKENMASQQTTKGPFLGLAKWLTDNVFSGHGSWQWWIKVTFSRHYHSMAMKNLQKQSL